MLARVSRGFELSLEHGAVNYFAVAASKLLLLLGAERRRGDTSIFQDELLIFHSIFSQIVTSSSKLSES